MSENPLIVPPREAVVELYPGDVEQRLADLKEQIAEADARERGPQRQGSKSRALALAEEYDALVESSREDAVKVTLRAVPHRLFRQLQDQHPPRKGNKRDELYGVNEDSFFPALVRASMVAPEVTEEQFAEFAESCHNGAWTALVDRAHELTTGQVALPKSSAVSVLRRMRDRESKQPGDTE